MVTAGPTRVHSFLLIDTVNILLLKEILSSVVVRGT